MIARAVWCACALACLSMAAHAGCPDDTAVAAYLEDFAAARPSRGFGSDLVPDDVRCARSKLVEALPAVLGERVGYKVAFGTAEEQKRVGIAGPAWGTMFAGAMMLNATLVPAGFAARPVAGAGLMVIVRDAGLADAESTFEALDHITDIVPFIELPDLMIEGEPTGPELVAINAAFRGGVLGPRIPVQRTRAFLRMIEEMEVVVADERAGRELGRARGSALMGQPIRAALWLAKALRKEGIALQPGELLSLGAFLPTIPVERGASLSASYLGLPDNPTVLVHFE